MLKLFAYLRKKEWGFLLFSLFFIVMQVYLDLKLPEYMSGISTLVQTPGSDSAAIWASGGQMLLCAFGSLVCSILVGYFAAMIAAGLSMRLREAVFEKVESFSMEEINGFSTASLITRSTNDITQVQMLVVMGLQVMVKAPIMAVWAIMKIAGKGYEWTLATALATLLLLVVVGSLIAISMPKFKRIQWLNDNLNRVTRENLTGLRVVRAYNAEEFQEEKFRQANGELRDNQLFAQRTMAIMNPFMNIVMNGLSLSIYWIGAVLINGVYMNSVEAMGERIAIFSNMVVFMSYAMQVVMSFMMLIMIFIMLPRAMVAAKRIREVLDTKPRILDGSLREAPMGPRGEVEFQNVSFRYPDAAEYALENISFRAKAGETVAFIGSTGSGKTSLVNLIPRFYDVSEGRVLVDGVDVRDYTQEALRNRIGYAPQRAVLFSGSVRSNVAYGENGREDFTEEAVKEAIAIAQARDFVEAMEGAYEAPIAQGGTNVSGGQKQRLSIARAVCRQPEIYIFDDSFSALDYKTDRILRSELKKQRREVTTLIVAQRIGTIRDADRIIVLDEGKQVGMGTHQELLKTCEVYRQIAQSQLSEEELEA